MKVNGREIKFLRTVKTNFDIAEICPEKKLERMGDLFPDDSLESIRNMVKFIQLMNQGYEEAKHYEDPTHEVTVIKEEDVMYMPNDEMSELFQEAVNAFLGIKQTVEVEPSKSKKKTSVTSD